METLGFSRQTIDGRRPVIRRVILTQRKSVLHGVIRRLKTWWERRPPVRSWKRVIVIGILIVVLLIILTLILLWFTLPNIDDPATMFPSQSTVILDRNGTELYRLFSEQDRTYVHGDQISQAMKQATIAIEDERFFSRGSCFDVIGFGRAFLSQLFPRIFVRSGGSTLTQQFAGNALVGRKRSVIRKIRELMLSCQLERKYDKDQLLELYLNWIPYGSNGYGVEQAARNYFGVPANKLTLAQSAVLASLPQRPSYFTPYGPHRFTTVSDRVRRDIERGAITTAADIPVSEVQIGLIGHPVGSGAHIVYVGGRTDQVLKNMLDQHFIAPEQHTAAIADLQKLTFSPERQNIRAPHFVLSIEKQVEDLLGIDEQFLEQGGLKITTTLDWKLQQIAEKIVAARRDDILKRFGANNIALLALKTGTREVLAYIGNTDYSDATHEGKIDMVTRPRQPGSSFKVFTYLSAFEQGYGPGSVIYDVPTKFGTDQPENYDGTYWGLTSIRRALAGSRNLPAVKAFFLGGGEEPLLSLAARMGVQTPLQQKAVLRQQNPTFDYGWPLAIGAAEVPLQEMVEGYATIADGGMERSTQTILKITDKDGNIRYLPREEAPSQVIDSRLTAQITSILSDASSRPENDYWKSILTVPGYDAAAKTGTSNKCLERDQEKKCTLRRPESTWTMGFTPNIVVGVWVGNATGQSLYEKADGLTIAAPIWHDFMVKAQTSIPDARTAFTLPDRLSRPLISRLSGELASPCTPVALQSSDLFLDERVPTAQDSACVLLTVDKVTGLLSSPSCPAEAQEQRAFFAPKSELPDRWPLWEEGVQDWVKKQMDLWNATPDHSGSLLPLPIAPTQQCDPALTPGRLEKPSVELVSPVSGGTVSFPAFKPQFSAHVGSLIKEVRFALDDKTIATLSAPPFSGIVRLPKSLDLGSSHTLTITITDTYFNTASASATVTLSRDAGTPDVQITNPMDGATISAGEKVLMQASADAASGIDRVQFFFDGKLLTTRREEPFEVTYAIQGTGQHTIRAVARSTSGAEAEDEVKISVQ